MSKISDKIIGIRKYLDELSTIIPKEYAIYKEDIIIKAACERYFELIIESTIDLATLIIKNERFSFPEDKRVFNFLYKKKIIDNNLAERLQDAKGMRNILSHRYGEIDNRTVFESIKKELLIDIKEFLEKTEDKYLKE